MMSATERSHVKMPRGFVARLFRALALIVLVASIGAIVGANWPLVRGMFSERMDLPGVAAYMNIEFPASVELVGAARWGVMRPMAIAHVRMSPAAFETFKEKSGLSFSSDIADRERILGSMALGDTHSWQWWRLAKIPDKFLHAYRSELTSDPSSAVRKRLTVFVDLDAADYAEVYLHHLVDA